MGAVWSNRYIAPVDSASRILIYLNYSWREIIVINVDGLELGTHVFGLEVEDEKGGTRSDGVLVNVISVIPEPSPVSKTYYITEEDDDDDGDDDELDTNSIIFVIAVTGGVIATAIIIHALLMKKRIVPETPTPSKKKQPVE